MRAPVDLPPEESLGFQVRRCHRAFDRVLNGHLAPSGLSSGFWYFLRALWQEDGATQKRLAQLNNVTEPTAVTLLGAMERLGLIARVRNAQDRRKINVFVTPKGAALKTDLMPQAHQINRIAAAGIAPDEIAACLSVLHRMSDNLAREAARLSAEPLP